MSLCQFCVVSFFQIPRAWDFLRDGYWKILKIYLPSYIWHLCPGMDKRRRPLKERTALQDCSSCQDLRRWRSENCVLTLLCLFCASKSSPLGCLFRRFARAQQEDVEHHQCNDSWTEMSISLVSLQTHQSTVVDLPLCILKRTDIWVTHPEETLPSEGQPIE